ncbi:O-antigen ligase family protein [Lentisphaera profundi]|uniref:O-antigen ligase family protein n=1 Tax=Lentisphaera profundi TaxID=1658616 RepID=A0ABY7VSY2_9BACT|nr:O-antigen ligase family protein [Lentisphaera profundi]WDE95951.1 O-antigen ligase family protein [Lentisphaera profundi]
MTCSIYLIHHIGIHFKDKHPFTRNKKILLSLSILLIFILCLAVLYKTQTRALIPAVAVSLFYFMLCRFPKRRIHLCVLSLVSIAFLAFTFQDKFYRLSLKDIRLPLLKDTASMIADAPFFGHGPGQFITKFSDYPSDELNIRLHSAPIYEHPHNEVFHMASQGGIPLTILFLGLLIFLLKKSLKNKDFSIDLATCILLFTLGLLDKSLQQGASLLLFYFFLARALIPYLSTTNPYSGFKLWQHLGALLSLALLTPALIQQSRASWHFKQADEYSHTNEQNKLKQAHYHLQRAHHLAPEKINYAYHCARLEIHLGQLENAWDKLEPIINSYPYYNLSLHQQGKLFENLALQQHDPASRTHLLKQAFLAYEASCKDRPWDLTRYPVFISLSQEHFPDKEKEIKSTALKYFEKKYQFRDEFSTPTQILYKQYLAALNTNDSSRIQQTYEQLIYYLKLPKDPKWQKFYLDSLKQ